MDFYTVKDLINMLQFSRSKVYEEIGKWNATLENEYGVKYTYPGRIRKDLYEKITGPIETEIKVDGKTGMKRVGLYE